MIRIHLILTLALLAVAACNPADQPGEPLPDASLGNGDVCEQHSECASGVCELECGTFGCAGICVACASDTQCSTGYCNTGSGSCEQRPIGNATACDGRTPGDGSFGAACRDDGDCPGLHCCTSSTECMEYRVCTCI